MTNVASFLGPKCVWPYLEMGSYCGKRSLCDKTEIYGAWCGNLGFGFKLFPRLVQIDLLLAKAQGLPVSLGDN